MRSTITEKQFKAKNTLVKLYNTCRDTKVSTMAEQIGVPRSTLNYLLMRGNFPHDRVADSIVQTYPNLADAVDTRVEYLRKRRHER